MVILAIRHIYLHFIMTYTYIISIEFMYTAEHRRSRSPMCTDIYTAEWSTATLVTPPSLAA